MKHQTMAVLTILSAAWICGHATAEAQLRPRGFEPAPVIGMHPPVVVQPHPMELQPNTLTPGNSPPLVVKPPPPVTAEAAPDGGDSACTCPDGQTADVEGWCWRRTDPASGYWAKTDKCQR